MAVTARIPRVANSVPRRDRIFRSASFLKAVTAPEASMRVIMPPMSAMTSTVNTLSTCPMVSMRASVYPGATPSRRASRAAYIPATTRDSRVRRVTST